VRAASREAFSGATTGLTVLTAAWLSARVASSPEVLDLDFWLCAPVGRSPRLQPRDDQRDNMKTKQDLGTKRDPAVEYIDSGLMTHRLKCGQRLSVRIAGNYGVYATRLKLGRRPDSSCTCPSENWPCKHVRALEATWKLSPKSFVDVGAFLRELSTKPAADLVKLIGEMILVAPAALSACGFPGFDPPGDEEEGASEWC
jgi:hypothetical protein